MRKDVTGYLYGGDVTRKNKLLDKQNVAKEMKNSEEEGGNPQTVFLEMLKNRSAVYWSYAPRMGISRKRSEAPITSTATMIEKYALFCCPS